MSRREEPSTTEESDSEGEMEYIHWLYGLSDAPDHSNNLDLSSDRADRDYRETITAVPSVQATPAVSERVSVPQSENGIEGLSALQNPRPSLVRRRAYPFSGVWRDPPSRRLRLTAPLVPAPLRMAQSQNLSTLRPTIIAVVRPSQDLGTRVGQLTGHLRQPSPGPRMEVRWARTVQMVGQSLRVVIRQYILLLD